MNNFKIIANSLVICALFGFIATGCSPKAPMQSPTEELQPQEQQILEQKPVEETQGGMKNEMEYPSTIPAEKKSEATSIKENSGSSAPEGKTKKIQ